MAIKEKSDLKITEATEKDIAQDKPLSFGNYLTLPITEERRDNYTNNIIKAINEILEDPERKTRLTKVEGWRNQYQGVVGEKDFPWPGSFNLDMRLTPKIQDAVVSQTQEAMEDSDPHWAVGPTPNKDIMPYREQQEKVLDYYEDVEMNNVEDVEGIRHDAFLLGNGYEAVIFERKFERVRHCRYYYNVQDFIKDFPEDALKYPDYIGKLAQGIPTKLVIEENQRVRRSPVRKHIEFEDAVVPIDAKGVEGMNNAGLIGRRVSMKWHEIKQLEDEGDYISGVSERLKYKSQLDKNSILEDDPEYLDKDYETFEVQYYIYLDINGKKRRVKCLFNVIPDYKLGLRAIRYPYDHNRCYIISHSIKYTNKGHYQDGIGAMLQDLHLAGNATINHILDASVLANSLTFKVKEGTDAARRLLEHRFYPGSALELLQMDDVQQLNFATPNLSSLIQLFAIIEKFGSDVTGVVNYQLGVSDSEDPEAPASKTIALMRKAEIKLRRYIKNLKRTEDEVGFQALRLIYQFTPVEELSAILGMDVTASKEFLYPALKTITQASGFAIEKIFAKRDDMTMLGNLMKDPLVMNDEIRRSRLWYTVAQDFGSNWDKKIIGIMPSPEELEQKQAEQQAKAQQQKVEAIQGAAIKVLDEGGNEEDAREVGMQTGKNIDAMRQKQAMMSQAQQQGGK